MISKACKLSAILTSPLCEASSNDTNVPKDCKILRNWAKAHGAAFRQRTARQETTMGKHGRMPEYMYQLRNKATECVDMFSDNHPDTTEDTNISEGRVDEESDKRII